MNSSRLFVRTAIVLLLAFVPAYTSAAAPDAQPLDVGMGERLFVVAPHPDDETLGASGLMQRVLQRGGSVHVVLMTAGDGYVEAVVRETGLPQPRPSQYVAYGERRLHEARAVLRGLARRRVHLEFLGFPDGGLQGLLRAHWQRTHPERSQTTGVADPPYGDALEPDVPYDGADLRRELIRLLKDANPTIVVFPHPLDKHPDHSAAGLFTLLAVSDWPGTPAASSTAAPRRVLPRLLAYLIHWPDWPPGWNATTPPPGTADAALDLPPNLPLHELAQVSVTLTDAEVAAKRAALASYASQQEEMAALLAAFVRRTEPFTVFTAGQIEHIGHMIEQREHTHESPQQR